jgi:signal peptidase I
MTDITQARSSAKRLWRENRTLLAFLFLMLTFRSAWADWVTVPSGSMNPTILEGDRLLVDKHVFGLRLPWTLTRLTDGRDPQRGEIVVFDSPVDGTSLVKRCVGLPGDVVALDERGLMINGRRADYAPGDESLVATLLEETQALGPQVLRESGVLPEHQVLSLRRVHRTGTFGPVRVPEGMYLMLGDNRENSNDSRYIGFVPRRNIVGHATRVVVSFDPDRYYLPRSGRWMQRLE